MNKLATLLVEVCQNGQLEMAKSLIDCGADINANEFAGTQITKKCRSTTSKRYYQQYNPLLISCYSKQTEIVKYLLSKSCKLNAGYRTNQEQVEDNHRWYDALHAACRTKNNKQIIDLLMKKKKDWNYKYLTEALDCDKDMIAYVNSKRERNRE